MKRISLLTAALLVACVSFAQMTRLSETVVESPKFKGDSQWNADEKLDATPICQYLQRDINNKVIYDEGVVSVLFTVNPDGTLSNYTIENSISSTTDKAVIACLESTSGNWSPGKVNGTPAEMQRKIFVSFYDPEKGTLQEQGNASLQLAVKKYHAAVEFRNSLTLSEKKSEKKANNRLKWATSLLASAERFLPAEPSVVFWQAAVYEQSGNEMMKNNKLNEFNALIDPTYQAQIELVDIAL